MVKIIIHGRPVPKERPRLGYKGRKAYIYTPKRTLEYEKVVGWAAKAEGCRPVSGPVAVELYVYARGNPDVDNIAKSVLDGLNGVAFEDDRQVIDLRVRKQKAQNKHEERVEIEVREAGEVGTA